MFCKYCGYAKRMKLGYFCELNDLQILYRYHECNRGYFKPKVDKKKREDVTKEMIIKSIKKGQSMLDFCDQYGIGISTYYSRLKSKENK